MKIHTVRSLCTATLFIGAIAGATALTGCRSTDDVSYRGITRNLTPELQGLHERPIDVDRNLAVMQNQNWRMFSDDLGRFFYTDHPSRLTPLPIMDTSGNPR